MSLSTRDTELRELMDDPECDPVRLHRTLERFDLVNRAVSGWAGVYRTHVRPALAAADGRGRILDVGCGGGDVLRHVVGLARADGFAVEALGIDPDPRALDVATNAGADPDIRYRAAFSHDLVAEGARFDVVLSNHVLHHLDTDAFPRFIADSERLAERVSLHGDIARSRFAYLGYAIAITPIAPGTLLRTDGLRSVRRSYRRDELAAVLPHGWRVERPRPFRLLAVRDGDAAEAHAEAGPA